MTIDVDGEAGLPDGGRGWEHRLSSRSERRYGVVRGLPRLLAAMERANAKATVFVPGITAERDPEVIEAILRGGHELALHGHTHRALHGMTAKEQRADLEAGLHALGRAPAGYRAPGWELTPETLDLLGEYGFAYDSSLMDDDRPYELRPGLLEFPVHWSLDDAPHFSAGGSAEALLAAWRRELALAVKDGRLLTVTAHPEILGRPHRAEVLEQLVAEAPRTCTLGEASVDAREQLARRDPERAGQPEHGREPRIPGGPLEP